MQRSTTHKRARSSSARPSSDGNQKDSETDESSSEGRKGSRAGQGKAAKLPSFLNQDTASMLEKFQTVTWNERERITNGMTNPDQHPKFTRCEEPEARVLDRYGNIFPWKANRVHLRVPEGKNDYVNASPITLQSSVTKQRLSYIAMQGPKKTSTDHAWRMMWEQLASPAVVVMLTETHEANVEKCFPYFPQQVNASLPFNDHDEFGDGMKGSVTCVEEDSSIPGTVVRKLNMTLDGSDEQKTIWHLLYTAWPDFGVPAVSDVDGFFDLMALSKAKNADPTNPRVIHCSAGVGRSGTFIALEYLLAELDAGAFDAVTDPKADPVFDCVNELREQRVMMVQAAPQYQFIYQVLRRKWEERHGAVGERHVSKMAKTSGGSHDDIFAQ